MQANILQKRLIPIAVINSVDDAVPLAEALLAGGLNVIEVTLRTKSAPRCIAAIKATLPEMIVGAGTILDPACIPQLIDSGVAFGVSPGINPRVIEAASKHELPILPGVMTATDIEQARHYDLELLKFFPAEAAGGVAFLKALAGPYAHTGIKFVPTGGINLSNLKDYIAQPPVAAVGGSWFVSTTLLEKKNYPEISRLTREALSLIHTP